MLGKKFMKFVLLVPACFGLALMAGVPNRTEKDIAEINLSQDENTVIVENPVHDFGKIYESGGDVSVIYRVVNNSAETILIQEARPSCGCTVASFTKTPIESGKSGQVKATFSPKNHPGPFNKSVTITTTGTPKQIVVSFKGTVINE